MRSIGPPRGFSCCHGAAFRLSCPVVTGIKSQTAEELQARFQAWRQPAWRADQLLEWLYVHRVTSWDAMTNLPKTLRDSLREDFSLQTLELVRKQGARDTTQKFLWRLADHSLIESVLIPANPALYGEPSDRHTLCVSTQVGCAYGCKFCASGLDGLKRNLRPEEIVDQVLAVGRISPESRVLSPESDDSLHSGLRTQHSGPRTPRLKDNISGGVKDGLDEIKALVGLARRLNAKINLIPYNRVEGLSWERPSDAAQEAFLEALEKQKIVATLRREKGHDIAAACGQLRLKTERELQTQ